MKRILITGITGFVGTNLVKYLEVNKEVQIFGYSRDIKTAKSIFNQIDFIHDLSANVLDRYLIDTVIHLAGIAHDLSGNYKKDDYQQVNYQWTTEIYNEFLKSNASSFVFVSSIKAISDHADQVIDENTIPNPTSDYGISKRSAENYILSNTKLNKKTFILRPCMIHGQGNKGNLNQLYKFVKARIPYPLAAFENKRSFLSIENFCFTIQNILNDKLSAGEYLVADSSVISTKDLVKLIGEVIGIRVRFIKVPKIIISGFARTGSFLKSPFNSKTLVKLVENMEVSNKKLLLNLEMELPVSMEDGLKKTIRSFDE